MFKSI